MPSSAATKWLWSKLRVPIEYRPNRAQRHRKTVAGALHRLSRPEGLDQLLARKRPAARRHEQLEQVSRLLRLPLGSRHGLPAEENIEPTQGLDYDRGLRFFADLHQRPRRSEGAVANAEGPQPLAEAECIGRRAGPYRQGKFDARLRGRTSELPPNLERFAQGSSVRPGPGLELEGFRQLFAPVETASDSEYGYGICGRGIRVLARERDPPSRQKGLIPRDASDPDRTFCQLSRPDRLVADDDPRQAGERARMQQGVLALLAEGQRRLAGRAGLREIAAVPV